MTREVWMPVGGFENYEVSNIGRVRNAQSGQVLRPSLNRGYAHVALYREPRRPITKYLHRLVLEAFCGPPPFPGAEGCHNNGDRSDNSLANLRWGSRQTNIDDRQRHGRTPYGTRHVRAKLTEGDVRRMRDDVRTGKASTYSIAKERGLSTNTVWSAVVGKTWKHVEGAVNNA